MPREVLMPRTIYSFTDLIELDASGQGGEELDVQGIRETLAEWALEHDWYEYTFDTWKSALAQIGIEGVKIEFSGFASQGDGASFTGSLDLPKLLAFMESRIRPSTVIDVIPGTEPMQEEFRPWLAHHGRLSLPVWTPGRGHLPLWLSEVSGRIVRDGYCRYSYAESCDVELEFHDGGYREHARMDKIVTELQDAIQELYGDLAHGLYRDLEQEHDFRISDEALGEDAEANDWWFDANGHRVDVPDQPAGREPAPVPAPAKTQRRDRHRGRPVTRQLTDLFECEPGVPI